MIKASRRAGYTIIEVLIFVVVSSALFFIAMTAIGGRQQQVQFTQSVRELDSKLKDVMNDVTTGYFPGRGEVKCNISSSAPNSERPQLQMANSSQGTSDNCIFVGKAIQFEPTDFSSNKTKSAIYIYTLVGRRTVNGGGEDVSSIAEANPIVIAPSSAGDNLADYTEKISLKWGLYVTRVVVPRSSPIDYGTIGFFNTFSATKSTSLISESQSVDLAAITNTYMAGSGADSEYSAVATLNTITDDVNETGETLIEKNPREGIIICLSNLSGKVASITLSSSGRTLNSTIQIDDVDKDICS